MSDSPPPSTGVFLPDYATSEEFCQAALKAIALTTKSSNALPSDNSETWTYYSTFKDFRLVMNKESGEVWDLIRNLLSYSSIQTPSKEPESTAELLDIVSEVNDQLLERIHTLLDEAEGLKTKEDLTLMQVSSSGSSAFSGSWNQAKNTSSKEPVLLTAKNILRPQMQFQSHIDHSTSPFIPRLKDKPHGMKPLSILLETDDSGEIEFYSHPYLFEISHFKLYPALLEPQPEVSSLLGIQDVPLIWVDSPFALDSLIQELLLEKEIAIDLEAHTYRSFMGITCLMQISTLSKDYIVDPFPLWGELTKLNEVLAHPKILKILHGSDSDVLWLQRDFSLYLVNIFDTYRGALLLELPKGSRSLKYLLSRYVGIVADKQYQVADWRIRPLPEEMKKYAREDTRYLIPIYRKMKKELLEKSNFDQVLLKAAYERSNDICLARFEKPIFHDMKHLDMLKKSKRAFNSKQLFALKELYAWRHRIARREDESEHYVLPNHMLLNICSELPREMQGIIALCSPIPPHVKQNLVELHKIIYEARGKPLTFKSAVQDDKNRPLKQFADIANNDVMTDPLKCPLDLSQYSKTDKLETLIGSTEAKGVTKKRPRRSPLVKVFENPSRASSQTGLLANGLKVPLSPFQRYKLLVPFLQSAKKEEKDTTEEKKTDKARMESLRKHFDELTQKSVDDSIVESSLSSKEKEELAKSDEGEEEEEATPKRPPKKEKPKANNLKRPSENSPSVSDPPPSKKKTPRDFSSYDLSQLSQSPNPNPDEYNPSKQFHNKHVNKKSKNKKRFNKAGSRSHSYKN